MHDTHSESLRGIASYDLNLQVILVNSSASKAVEAVSSLLPTRIEANIYQSSVQLVYPSCIIYRLRNYQWAIIEFFGEQPALDWRNLYCSISKSVRDEVLFLKRALYLYLYAIFSLAMVISLNLLIFRRLVGLQVKLQSKALIQKIITTV